MGIGEVAILRVLIHFTEKERKRLFGDGRLMCVKILAWFRKSLRCLVSEVRCVIKKIFG